MSKINLNNTNMTFEEAKVLARQGIKMTHEYFTDVEFLTMSGNICKFEDGCQIMVGDWADGKDYLLNGWSIFNESKVNLNTSNASDSISFETKDYETVKVKVGENNISIKTTKSNGTFNTIYIEEGQQLFDYLKKYYH
jgi:hypothetical protein